MASRVFEYAVGGVAFQHREVDGYWGPLAELYLAITHIYWYQAECSVSRLHYFIY